MFRKLIQLSVVATLAFTPVVLLAQRPNYYEFDGLTFHLTNKDSFDDTTASSQVTEYLPGDQSMSNWSNLLGLRQHKSFKDPSQFAMALAELVKQQGGTVLAADTSSKTEAFLAFYLSSQNGVNQFTELNFWHFTKNASQANVISMQYAVRFYGNEGLEQFLASKVNNKSYIAKVQKGLNAIPIDRL